MRKFSFSRERFSPEINQQVFGGTTILNLHPVRDASLGRKTNSKYHFASLTGCKMIDGCLFLPRDAFLRNAVSFHSFLVDDFPAKTRFPVVLSFFLRRHDTLVNPDIPDLSFQLVGGVEAAGVLAEDHRAGPGCRVAAAVIFADQVAVLIKPEFFAVVSGE